MKCEPIGNWVEPEPDYERPDFFTRMDNLENDFGAYLIKQGRFQNRSDASPPRFTVFPEAEEFMSDAEELAETCRLAALERRLVAERLRAGWPASPRQHEIAKKTKCEESEALAKREAIMERRVEKERLHAEWLECVNARLHQQNKGLLNWQTANAARYARTARLASEILSEDYEEDKYQKFREKRLRKQAENSARIRRSSGTGRALRVLQEAGDKNQIGHVRTRLLRQRLSAGALAQEICARDSGMAPDLRTGPGNLDNASQFDFRGRRKSVDSNIFRRGTLWTWSRNEAKFANDPDIAGLLWPDELAAANDE